MQVKIPSGEPIFWILVIFLVVYEIITITTGERGRTISEIIWRLNGDSPIFAFAMGLLCGHLFWRHN